MKELKIVGQDGIEIAKCLVDVKGEDFQVEFRFPIMILIAAVSLVEQKEEE